MLMVLGREEISLHCKDERSSGRSQSRLKIKSPANRQLRRAEGRWGIARKSPTSRRSPAARQQSAGVTLLTRGSGLVGA